LEALASFAALQTLRHSNVASDIVTVRAAKPAALVLADSAEVEISRRRGDYPDDFKLRSSEHSTTPCPSNPPAGSSSASPNGTLPPVALPTPTLAPTSLTSHLSHVMTTYDSSHPRINATHIAAIALGTNMGDRFANIELALRLLEAPHSLDLKDGIVSIIDTSFMYETTPMYVTDQPMFINCACLVRPSSRKLRGYLTNIQHPPKDRD
jgi:dihydroneopterin aldolase/2-amino-4-hydroxy-6-hydroxymethyldihydropteridine diphosphokinase/dihydropteroate synthase